MLWSKLAGRSVFFPGKLHFESREKAYCLFSKKGPLGRRVVGEPAELPLTDEVPPISVSLAPPSDREKI